MNCNNILVANENIRLKIKLFDHGRNIEINGE